MTTVGELLNLYEKFRGGKDIGTRIVYFHGLSREFMGYYSDVPLSRVDGEMTLNGFHSASCNGLRFESFCSGIKTTRCTLVVSRDGSSIAFE